MNVPTTNVALLKLLLVGNPLALALVTAASGGSHDEAVEAVKRVLLQRVQDEINALRNGETEVD